MTRKMETRTLVTGALLTAIVFLLQFLGASIKFGPFSISLVLIPIVIGAVTCGKWVGAWLGYVFGLAVLLSGDATFFMGFDIFGTIITVLLKGTACGFIAGLLYELIFKVSRSSYLSAIVAAIICPIVNTGIFLLGCLVFLMDAVAALAGSGENLGQFMIFVLVGTNFLVEMATVIIFSPAIAHIIKVVTRRR